MKLGGLESTAAIRQPPLAMPRMPSGYRLQAKGVKHLPVTSYELRTTSTKWHGLQFVARHSPMPVLRPAPVVGNGEYPDLSRQRDVHDVVREAREGWHDTLEHRVNGVQETCPRPAQRESYHSAASWSSATASGSNRRSGTFTAREGALRLGDGRHPRIPLVNRLPGRARHGARSPPPTRLRSSPDPPARQG